jgi:GTP-binding protein
MVLVDLPGYGYAAAPLQVRASWGRSVEEYLTTRESLCGVVLVIDARRGMRDTDRAALEVLEASGRAVVVVVNKVDKLRMGDRSRRMAEIAAEVAEPLAFSAVTGEGKAALWRRLAGLAALR